MAFSDVLQLDMPDLFPLAEFESFWNSARQVLPHPTEERSEFNGASNLIGWRFRNCIEYHEDFLRSWSEFGVGASFEQQYTRERALFGMFLSGVSAIESICYACFAIGAELDGLRFPFDERSRKGVTPTGLRKHLEKARPSASLTTSLVQVLDSQEWELWNDYRNTMAHRSSVPRIIYAIGGPGTLPPAKILEYARTWSTDALSGDENTLFMLVSWLAEAAKTLLKAGEDLARGT